nr:MAG TPA: hypothetical protein [Caudoviricetes sp.]
MLKKLYISFCYIINFLICLSLTLKLLTKLFSVFLTSIYSTYLGEINLLLLLFCVSFSIYLVKKFYTPTTEFIFR